MGLGLFFFGWIWDKNGNFNEKPLIRILAAFFLVNFIPFVYFALIYDWLGTFRNDPTFFQIIGTFFLSLYVFGIYRIFHLIIKKFKKNLYGIEIHEEKYHKIRNRLDAIGPSNKGQLVSILFYIVIALWGAFWIDGIQAVHELRERSFFRAFVTTVFGVLIGVSIVLLQIKGRRARKHAPEGYDRAGKVELTEVGKTWIQKHYPKGIVWDLNLEEPFKLHSVAAEFVELTYMSIPYRIPHKVGGKTTIRKLYE